MKQNVNKYIDCQDSVVGYLRVGSSQHSER